MTATGPSLKRAQEIYSSATSGARSSAGKFIFFLTDGQSNENDNINPKDAADQLKQSGAEIYALGKIFSK